MGIKNFYRRSAENSLANYDYNDFAEGTGIVEFNLGSDYENYSDVTDEEGEIPTSSGASANKRGVKITARANTYLKQVIKDPTCDASVMQVYDSSGTGGSLLATAYFIGNSAVLETPLALTNTTSYYVVVGNNGVSYTSSINSSYAGKVGTNVEFVAASGWDGAGTSTNWYNIQQIMTGSNALNQKYFLTRNDTFSHDQATILISSSQSSPFTTTKEIDFDLAPFNMPHSVKGTAYFTCSYKIITTATAVVEGKVLFELKKYDGSTETTIGTATTAPICTKQNSGHVTASRTTKVPMTITNTHFKAGETLRLTITLQLAALDIATSTQCAMMFMHDPQNANIDTLINNAFSSTDFDVTINSTGSAAADQALKNGGLIRTTQAKAFIPFRLDL